MTFLAQFCNSDDRVNAAIFTAQNTVTLFSLTHSRSQNICILRFLNVEKTAIISLPESIMAYNTSIYNCRFEEEKKEAEPFDLQSATVEEAGAVAARLAVEALRMAIEARRAAQHLADVKASLFHARNFCRRIEVRSQESKC
jgi:hypothetical protein